MTKGVLSRKQIGRIGLSCAIHYFTVKGYTISLPLNDTQWYDLIVEKDDKFSTIQCKSTNTSNASIELKSTGGTNGSAYDTVFEHPKLDYLFCTDKDLNMWLIPIKDIPNNKSITLRLTKQSNGQGFETMGYVVSL